MNGQGVPTFSFGGLTDAKGTMNGQGVPPFSFAGLTDAKVSEEKKTESDVDSEPDIIEKPVVESPVVSDEEENVENQVEHIEFVEKHEFSMSWRSSDLVLIIEEQKIHVHRLILEMASQVLCHLFKETDSNEVPLLRTKVKHFVDLLRVIYPQFENKITLDNVMHIYRLSEEYEIEGVTIACREYLAHTKKNSTNAMKILVTSQVCNAGEARDQCYEKLKQLTVAEMKLDQHFQGLDEQSLRKVLLPKAERLENCLRDIEPQLVGLIDCVLYLWLDNNRVVMGAKPTQCPVHHALAIADTSMKTRIKCSACEAMFLQMAKNSRKPDPTPSEQGQARKAPTSMSSLFDSQGCVNARHAYYYSSSGMYFKEEVVDILREMFNLLETRNSESVQHQGFRFRS